MLPGQVLGRRQGQWARSGVSVGWWPAGRAGAWPHAGPWGPRLSHSDGPVPPASHTPERPLPAGACVLQGGSEHLPAGPPIHTEGLHLFLRQSCILILDVSPEAYFS